MRGDRGHGSARNAAAGLLLAFFAANGVIAARTDTPTVDEFVHAPIGY